MSGPQEDAAAAGVPGSSPPEPPAPRASRPATPPPRGRPGLSWDGRGTLGQSTPEAGVRAAPVPREAAPPAPPPIAPAPLTRPASPASGAVAGGALALDLRRGGSVASFGRRAVGFVADQLTLGLVLLLLLVLGVDSGGVMALSLAIPLGYHWLFDSLGWSPGKLAAGLRLVNARGQPPGILAGGARALVALLIPLNLSYVWAAWDSGVQTLHDKAARTYVVTASALAEAERERSARP